MTVNTANKLILITEFIEQKLRKEQELEFYVKELDALNRKIGFLRGEVSLTNTIIDMIKREQVYDVEENMIEDLHAVHLTYCMLGMYKCYVMQKTNVITLWLVYK